jgi:hypothetical protein
MDNHTRRRGRKHKHDRDELVNVLALHLGEEGGKGLIVGLTTHSLKNLC